LGALFSFALRVPSTHSSIIWAPNAVLLTALVVTPPRTWLIWLAAALPAHLIAQSRDAAPVLLLICPYLANIAQAVLAAVGLRRFMDVPYRLESLREMAVFILVAVLAAPALVSLTAAWLFVAAGWETDYWLAAEARLLNNILTGLTVAPLCFAIGSGDLAKFRRVQLRRYVELAFLLTGLAGTIAIAFAWQANEMIMFPIRLYAPLPFLFWAAVRFQPAAVSVALLIIAYDSISDSIAGQGIFASGSGTVNVLAVEASLGVLSLPLMLLAALMQERTRKEEALRESEARYRALVTASSEIVWRAKTHSEGLFVTPAWRELTGQSEAELRNSGWLNAVHPEDRERCRRLWDQAGAQRHGYEDELRVQALDESYRHFYVHVVPILSPDGSVREWVGTANDITDRKRAEQTLRESEARFRNMADHAPVMIWISDPRGSRTYVNRRWTDFTGAWPEQALGFRWLESVHAADRKRIREVFTRMQRRKEEFRIEYHLRRHDGEYRWVINSASPRFNETGELLGFIGSIIDITERKRIEEALRESEERLARTEKFSLVMVTHTDLEGRWLKVPPTLCELLGYSEEELLGRRFHEVTHPDDIDQNLRERLRLLKGEIKSFDMEKRYVRKDGGIVWVYINVSVVTDEAGTPIHCLSYIRDITRRKGAQDALRDSEERLQLALEAGGMGIWDWDKRHNTLQWSSEYFTIMGLAPFSVTPTYETWIKRVHPDDRPAVVAAMKRAIEGHGYYRSEYRVIFADGNTRWVTSHGKASFDQNGKCVRMLGVASVITERKRTEEALRNALAEVQRLKERVEADNVYLREELSETLRDGEIVGKSEAIRKVLNQVRQVAATDMAVLILGETGTGKELVARAIHGTSARKERPLVKVNCSALPANLMESELFGHEKGAFTGAVGKRIGRFELADGGTIFLDEIGDLALSLQAKLLRVLQEGEFERVGSSKTIHVNVRVIAATNRDLSEALRQETFRSDLYYRLAVYPIQMPPLRERKEDIKLMAEVFLQDSNRRLGKSFEGIPRRMLEALERYDWPGNVRELQNVIERAAVTSTGRSLQLPEPWHAHTPVKGLIQSGAADSAADGAGTTLEDRERTHIIQILNQTHWRIEGPQGAAVVLGLRPSTLRSRMQKLGIKREAYRAELH
jgi:PAS domain S-box-containing protein